MDSSRQAKLVLLRRVARESTTQCFQIRPAISNSSGAQALPSGARALGTLLILEARAHAPRRGRDARPKVGCDPRGWRIAEACEDKNPQDALPFQCGSHRRAGP